MVAVNITVLILQGASGVRAGQASVLYPMKTSVSVSDAFTLAAFIFTLFTTLFGRMGSFVTPEEVCRLKYFCRHQFLYVPRSSDHFDKQRI